MNRQLHFEPVSTAKKDLDITVPDNAAESETEAILFALAQAVEQRDPHTAQHCERLAVISVAMGTALHLDPTSLQALYRGGYLHDVGKVGIPDSILFKPGKLNAQEWMVMRSHPVRGVDICRHLKTLAPVLPIIRHHHERWDGSGYPDGLRGTQIPLLARVLQIADIYDALTSPRPYKRAYPIKQALRIIEKETDRGWRDPEIVSLFFELHSSVITQIDAQTQADGNGLKELRATLTGLAGILNSGEYRGLSANGHTFSPLLRSVPANGSLSGAADTWRRE